VLEGEELLEPAEPDERELLGLVDGPPGSRLACQVRVKSGAGIVRVKPVGT
jgi:ferredoxin